MRRQGRIVAAAVAMIIAFIAAACGALSGMDPDSGIFYGTPVAVGLGDARAYVVLQDGAPVEVGIALSELALDGLPEADPAHAHDVHAMMHEYLLPLPKQAERTGYQLVELDWNPLGHEPDGIYNLPHFDAHFYLITLDQRNAIDPALETGFDVKAARYPSPEFIPEGFFSPAPVALPRMGVHWVDAQAPELHGARFEATFIYGTWDGEVIFTEPMITREFLLSRPNRTTELPVPQRFARPGAYPTSYTTRWDDAAREYRIALTGLVQRD